MRLPNPPRGSLLYDFAQINERLQSEADPREKQRLRELAERLRDERKKRKGK